MVHQYHSNSWLLRDTSISARPLAILLLLRICDELQMDVTEGKLVRDQGSSEPKNLTSSQMLSNKKMMTGRTLYSIMELLCNAEI